MIKVYSFEIELKQHLTLNSGKCLQRFYFFVILSINRKKRKIQRIKKRE